MKNKITDLRNHLFETIEALKDAEKPMDIERAKAIADVAQVIVNSAKVEVDFLRMMDANTGTGFIELNEPAPGLPRLVKGRDTR
jgi:hypothetical protein